MSLLEKSNCDIICLQEIWYGKQDLGMLNSLHREFHGTGAVTTDYRDNLSRGYPPGGVAILWRSHYDKYITPLKNDHDWLTGITLSFEKKKYVLLCVYMPCLNNSPKQEETFLENLGLLHSAIEELDCTCVSIFGDWNADISNDQHLFGKHVSFVMIQGSPYQVNWNSLVTALHTGVGVLGFNASATARVISRRWNDDDEISFLVEVTGVSGGNHRPTASNPHARVTVGILHLGLTTVSRRVMVMLSYKIWKFCTMKVQGILSPSGHDRYDMTFHIDQLYPSSGRQKQCPFTLVERWNIWN